MPQQPQIVQGPDGKVIQFPAGMSPDQINQAMQTIYRPGVPDPRQQVQPQYQDILTGKPGDAATAQGVGAMKGPVGDAALIFHLLSRLPGIGQYFDQDKLKQMQEFAQPANPAEALGKTTEQAGEMIVGPSAAGKAVTKGAEAAGLAGKALKGTEIAGRATATGAINKAQGGDFSTGAALSAGGDIIGGLGNLMKAGKAGPDELSQAKELAATAFKNTKGYKNVDVKNAVSAFHDAVKVKDLDEAIANVEQVHQTLLDSSPGMAQKTESLYNKLMSTLQGSISTSEKGYSKVQELSNIMRREAAYRTLGGLTLGGLYGHERGETIPYALTMGAGAYALPGAARQIPNFLTAMPPVMRSAPAISRGVTGKY